MRKTIFLTLFLVILFAVVRTVEACTTPPEPKYLNCDDLGTGYKYGFLINGSANGKYLLTSKYGILTGGAPADPNNAIKILNSKNGSFQWTASLGIDAVIVDAGPKSKVYKLNESTGATTNAPRDAQGHPYAIKKVEFCYDYQLTVTKTAEGSFDRATGWDISKDVTPAAQAKFAGETAAFDYTVQVHQANVKDSNFVVSGKVVVQNNTPLPAIINSIKDTIRPGAINVTLDCQGVKFPYTLAAHKSMTCTYTKPLTSRLEGENQAVVTTATCSKVGGASTLVKIAWKDPATPGTGPITVTDTNAAFGGPKTVTSGDKTWKYSVQLTCSSDPAQYVNGKWSTTLDNTATIVETGQKASQKVTLDCYAPALSQTLSTSLDRKYTWSINKSSAITEQPLQLNQSKGVEYNVKVDVANKADANYKVSGAVKIGNPNPAADLTVDLADLLDGNALSLSDCASPVTIPAGGSKECKFETALAQAGSGANTATVKLNNIAFQSSAGYDFTNPKLNEIDECINVTDDHAGALGTTCADKAPQVYTYNLMIGPYAECGDKTFDNIASFVTNDTQATGSSKWTIKIPVSCDTTICTYTQAYWSATSDPSDTIAYDKTWDLVQPSGPSSPFFATGKTWAEVFKLDSAVHNYYALGHEYMAARLNMLRGASAPDEVVAALDHAKSLLTEYATHMLDIQDEVYIEFNDVIFTLQNYNTGAIGPGHCCDEITNQ